MKEKHIQKISKFLFFGFLIYFQFYRFFITFIIFTKSIDTIIFYFCQKMDNLEQKPKDNVPIYVSIATTPSRIENFVKYSLPNFKKYEDINLIINLCKKYKRFNKTINKNSLKKIKNLKNIYIHWTDDYGPITKLIGGKQFLKKNNLTGHFLVADDDDYYSNKLFYRLINLFNEVSSKKKTTQMLVTGSIYYIFNPPNIQYIIPYKKKFVKLYKFYQIYKKIKKNNYFKCYKNNNKINFLVEGFKGILFNKLSNENLENFTNYYKVIDYNKNNDDCLVNEFLQNCFLADDFVITYFYKNCEFIHDMSNIFNNKLHFAYDYGFKNDALHKTFSNCNEGNIKRYKFLRKNQLIFNTFCNKNNLNKEIIKTVPSLVN